MKLKSNIIIILLIGLFIFLGIVILYTKNKKREGITTTEIATLTGNIKTQMSAAGINIPSSDNLSTLLNSIKDMATNETAAAAAAAPAATEPASINTVAPILQPITFFTGNKFGDAFCFINGSNPTTLEAQCGTLNSNSCNATDCCVWLNGNTCKAGNANGPSTLSDSFNPDDDYYSYKYKCYGNCNSPVIVPSSTIDGSGANIDTGTGANIGTGLCETDDTATNVTSACVNKIWTQLKCDNTWAQLPTNTGWYNIPDSILAVNTTNKNLYHKDNSTHIADITGQNMETVRMNMLELVTRNPAACVAK